jgi:predicted protein tyrosine phosphatase
MHTIRPWLSIGTLQETQDRALLDAHKVGAMLQLHRPVSQAGIPSLYVPVKEGLALQQVELADGLAFVREQRAAGAHVLIACGAGISRSVTFGVGALAQAEDLDLTSAFEAIYAIHTQAMPDERHWQALCQYFDDAVDFWAMWQNIAL